MRISDWSSDVCSSDLKPGGHGERCVAVGTLDMAVWDAAAKVAGLPLYRFLADRIGAGSTATPRVPVYAGGGEDRKSGVSGKRVSVRVDLGGRRLIKKKKQVHKSRVTRHDSHSD